MRLFARQLFGSLIKPELSSLLRGNVAVEARRRTTGPSELRDAVENWNLG